LKTLVEDYLSDCKSILNYNDNNSEHYIALANACCKLANRLHAREYSYYRLPAWTESFIPNLEKFSCWCHWQDIHRMKELLLQASVREHIGLVKNQPTSLETHAALANAYVMLSGLYIDPRKMEGYEDDRWIPEDKYNEESLEKFRIIAERAIEEFKILGEYAPDDPWVHCQLAYSYHDLQMPLEEIKEYEAIQRLIPDDKDNLYKLGILYFQQGWNAKGLRVYEELKRSHYKKGESLIKYYGTYETLKK
jgi:tetratricopeptide (TPR) repeat protein